MVGRLRAMLARVTRDRLLGIGARGLFVLVKPAALWAAIQLDSDGGARLAQVYLVGLLALSLMGTNAHRAFYRARFEKTDATGRFGTARRYRGYLDDLTRQIIAVLGVLALLSMIWPDAMLDFVLIGLVFGLAEKISDEGVRYTQFCLDNRGLMGWALTKVAATAAAVVLAFGVGVDIGIGFPLLLLGAMAALAAADLRRALRGVLQGLHRGLGHLLRTTARLFYRDAGQIAWVFTTMGLMNLDKWTLQTLATDRLAGYMLVAQIAAVFIVAQTVFVLAPARVELVNRNPGAIPSLRRGSLTCALAAWACGLGVFLYSLPSPGDTLLYYPFLLAGIFVLSAPWLERLYWVVADRLRIGIDAGFIMLLAAIMGGIILWTGSVPNLHAILGLLAVVLGLRLGVIALLIQRYPGLRQDGSFPSGHP